MRAGVLRPQEREFGLVQPVFGGFSEVSFGAGWIVTRERVVRRKLGLDPGEKEPPIRFTLVVVTGPTWVGQAWFWKARGRGRRWRGLMATPELKWAVGQPLAKVRSWAGRKGYGFVRMS